MNDLYMSEMLCTDRLFKEYLEHKSLIIAVDFDDTIYDFDKKGFEYPRVIDLLKEAVKLNMKVVIYTTNQDHDLITDYCNEIELPIAGINKQLLPQFKDSGKLYYNILLDDRVGLSSSFGQLTRVINLIKGEKIV